MTTTAHPIANIGPDTIIKLPRGWTLDFDERDDGSLQGFVHNDRTGQHASLGFALETETDSERDEDIPMEVILKLREYSKYE